MLFTSSGLYNQNERLQNINLFDGVGYSYSGGFISTKSVVNNDPFSPTIHNIYVICSKDNNVYYWNGLNNENNKCKKLEGTFNPPAWNKNTHYNYGDVVKPKTDSEEIGLVYMCVSPGGGTSHSSTEPNWREHLDFVNQFTDGTVSWKGVGTYGLEGTSFSDVKARFVEEYKGFVFLANLKEDEVVFPSRVRWSQYQNPRMWHNNEDSSGMSGYVDVNDVEGEIVQIKKLNDILVVYKEKGIVAMTFTGGDTVFSKEVITTRTGLMASGAIIEMPHSHIFVGDDNIYEFDGNSVTPIGDPIKDYFFNTLIPKGRSNVIGYYDKDQGDIMFVYDMVDSNRMTTPDELYPQDIDWNLNSDKNRSSAITFNVSTKTWSKREMYITAIGEFSQTENVTINSINVPIDEYQKQIEDSYGLEDKIITICGDELGNVFKILGYKDSRRSTYYGYVTSKVHHMEDPGHIKRLLRIQFHIETKGDCVLKVDVGTGWNSETIMKKWETHNINLNNPIPPFVDVDLSARYFQIRFGTENNNEYFKVLGYTLYYQTRGDE